MCHCNALTHPATVRRCGVLNMPVNSIDATRTCHGAVLKSTHLKIRAYELCKSSVLLCAKIGPSEELEIKGRSKNEAPKSEKDEIGTLPQGYIDARLSVLPHQFSIDNGVVK